MFFFLNAKLNFKSKIDLKKDFYYVDLIVN